MAVAGLNRISMPGPGDPETWGPVWHPNDPRQPEPPEPSDEELEAEELAATEAALQAEREAREEAGDGDG